MDHSPHPDGAGSSQMLRNHLHVLPPPLSAAHQLGCKSNWMGTNNQPLREGLLGRPRFHQYSHTPAESLADDWFTDVSKLPVAAVEHAFGAFLRRLIPASTIQRSSPPASLRFLFGDKLSVWARIGVTIHGDSTMALSRIAAEWYSCRKEHKRG